MQFSNIVKYMLCVVTLCFLAACSNGGTGTPGNAKAGLKVVYSTAGTYALDMVIAEPAQPASGITAGDVIITGTLDSNTGTITGTYNDTRFTSAGSTGPFTSSATPGSFTPGNPAGTYTYSGNSSSGSFTIDSSGVITGSTSTGGTVKSYKLTANIAPTLPAGVTRVTLTVTPANSSSFTPSPIDITSHASISIPSLTDNESYTFRVDAYNASNVVIYQGSATAVMLPAPATNPVSIVCSPYTAPVVTTASWAAKTAMTTPRSRAMSAQVNGIIYVMGGQGVGGVAVNTVEAFDPATNSWTTKASMPTPRMYGGAAAVGSNIYVMGGIDATSSIVSTVDVFNTVTGTWQTHPAAMPAPRARLACVAHNGIIYAIGGTDATGGVYSAAVETFNPSLPANNWILGPSLNTARARFSAIIGQDSSGNAAISVKGGDTASGATSSQEVFNLTPTPAASWTIPTISLPAARTRHAATVAGNFGYVIGGEDSAAALTNVVWSYDFTSATPAFATLASTGTVTPRAYPVVQTVNGQVYVIGGEIVSGASRVASNLVEELTPAGALPRIGKSTAMTGLLTVAGAEINGASMLLVGQQVANGPLFSQLVNISNITGSTPVALNITPATLADPTSSVAVGPSSYLIAAPEAGGVFISALDIANPGTVLNKVRIDDTVAANVNNDVAIASNGKAEFLVSWTDATNIVYGRLVDNNGNPTSAAFSIGSGTVLDIKFGNGIYLVLTGTVIPTNIIELRGTVVTPGVASAGPSTVLISSTGTNFWGNIGAYNGSEFGIVATVGNGTDDTLYAAPVQYNGTSLIKRSQLAIAPAPGAKSSPHAAWDGFKWTVSWFEHDSAGSGTGYYRHVDSNGTPLGAKVSFTPVLSGTKAGGRVWWSNSLNSYLLGWGSGAGLSYATLQP